VDLEARPSDGIGKTSLLFCKSYIWSLARE
jgi:hypothetical protein